MAQFDNFLQKHRRHHIANDTCCTYMIRFYEGCLIMYMSCLTLFMWTTTLLYLRSCVWVRICMYILSNQMMKNDNGRWWWLVWSFYAYAFHTSCVDKSNTRCYCLYGTLFVPKSSRKHERKSELSSGRFPIVYSYVIWHWVKIWYYRQMAWWIFCFVCYDMKN